MDVSAIQSFLALAIGFAVAGVLTSGYAALAERPLGFTALMQASRNRSLVAVPVLVFAAPAVIMRHTLRAARAEGGNFGFVAIATVIAGGWSLLSGTVVAAGWVELVRLMA
ncbi:MAG: hypothetical protein J0H62_06425 [Rhizobiales bacterium]|nr:hypothetical protein [Hyphomicrobiales bacterium]